MDFVGFQSSTAPKSTWDSKKMLGSKALVTGIYGSINIFSSDDFRREIRQAQLVIIAFSDIIQSQFGEGNIDLSDSKSIPLYNCKENMFFCTFPLHQL